MMKRIAVALVALFCLAPVVWQAITSLKTDVDLTRIPPLLPTRPVLDNYVTIFTETPFARVIWNSFLVASLTTILSLLFGSLAAFALAKLEVRRRSWILAGVLSVSMFPPIATVSPLYEMVRAIGLRDSPLALVLLYSTFSLPLGIWVMTNFFRNVPDELLRAARVDGCTVTQAFFRIMLPLAAPGLVATGLLVFISAWNEFLLALTFTVTTESRTIPVAIALFPGLHEIPWGEIAAASVVVTMPIAVLVFAFQRRIVEGLTAGAVKG
jgi:multiple sugar transport system permease protein